LIKIDSPDDCFFEVSVAFISKDWSHWDYNFLKMSVYFGDQSITMMGYYKPIDDLARQLYCDGDYDTGIMVGDPSYYTGEEMMMTDYTHITESDFDCGNFQS